jgi:hypothetical protein
MPAAALAASRKVPPGSAKSWQWGGTSRQPAGSGQGQV